jgi:hypothetical protein
MLLLLFFVVGLDGLRTLFQFLPSCFMILLLQERTITIEIVTYSGSHCNLLLAIPAYCLLGLGVGLGGTMTMTMISNPRERYYHRQMAIHASKYKHFI